MIQRGPQLKCTLRSLQCPKIAISRRPPLRSCIVHQTRPISFESITTPFSRRELKAAATGNPDLSSEYYLLYVGPLARRVATYKIGAFLLSASGLAVSPVVAATAEVPLMALPVVLLSSLPLLGYHYLTRRYVLSMHLYVPPHARSDLRTFTSYVNSFRSGMIVRFRTFRMIFGIKSDIVPVDELKLVTVPGRIQAFEKNLEWTSSSLRSRTIFGRKAWYVQPGLGGQEMDSFWRRIGMEDKAVKVTREKAVAKMKELSRQKVKGLQEAVDKYESGGRKERAKKIKKISMR